MYPHSLSAGSTNSPTPNTANPLLTHIGHKSQNKRIPGVRVHFHVVHWICTRSTNKIVCVEIKLCMQVFLRVELYLVNNIIDYCVRFRCTHCFRLVQFRIIYWSGKICPSLILGYYAYENREKYINYAACSINTYICVYFCL